MKSLTGYVCLLALTAGVPAAFANNGVTGAVSGPGIERELKALRAEKKELLRDVATLGAMARSTHMGGWEMQQTTLGMARERINRSGARLAKLEASGENLTVKQKEAVSALTAELTVVAEQTGALIMKVNDDRNYVRTPSYFKEVQAMVASAERTAKTADRVIEVALESNSGAQSGD